MRTEKSSDEDLAKKKNAVMIRRMYRFTGTSIG